jgi:tetratricopeptide (TPR) repeat protein
LSYLEEVRGLAAELDDRRRAAFLHGLANSYCETGDYEAAIRTGYASLALFKAAETSFDMARLENELAIAHLNTGNLTRAEEMASDSSKRFAELGDDRQRSHVLDTQAQIALARGDAAEALRLATESLNLARDVGNGLAVSDAMLTIARALAAGGANDAAKAKKAFEVAAEDARQSGRPQTIKRVLTAYADWLAATGDHKQAFELSREALATSR